MKTSLHQQSDQTNDCIHAFTKRDKLMNSYSLFRKVILSAFMLCFLTYVYSQSLNYGGWEIQADYLTSGKLRMLENQTVVIKYNITVKRFLSSNGSGWDPVNYKFQLFRKAKGATLGESVPLMDIITITGSDFPQNDGILTREYSLSLKAAAGAEKTGTTLRHDDEILFVVGGPWSPNKSYFVTIVSKPGAPTGLQASAITATGCTLSWTAPAQTGSEITGYKIYKNDVYQQSTTARSIAVSNLSSNTNYSFAVSTYNSAGESAKTSINVATMPAAPEGLSASAITASGCTLTWNIPPGTITAYKVFQNGAFVQTVSTNNAVITGLSQGASYTFTVSALNDTRESVQSTPLTVTTGTLPSIPANFNYYNLTTSSVLLAWNSSTGIVSGYRVSQIWPTAVEYTTTVGHLNLNDLIPGATYLFTVRAYNQYGISGSSNTVAFVVPAPLAAPTNLNASNITSVGCTLSWTPPVGNISGYKIFQNGVFLKSSSTANTTVSLNPNTTYSFYVIAHNAAGESGASNTITVTTPVLVVPSQPGTLWSSNVTSSSCQLSWYASSGIVTGYRIYRNGALILNTTSLNATITGLSAGTTYSFFVKAYNAAGESIASNTISVATKSVTVPLTPANFRISGGTPSTRVFSWDPSQDATGYYLYINVGTSNLGRVQLTATTYTFSGGSGTFNFYVTAYNSFGESPKSNTIFTTMSSGGRLDMSAVNFESSETSLDNEDVVVLYPNPVREKLIISGINEEYAGSLIDLRGKTVRQFSREDKCVEVSNLASGFYFVHIKTRDGMIVKRIIIE